MPNKYLLFLSSDRVSAHLWHSNRLAAEQVFPNDPEGRSAFAGFLRDHGKKPLYLLTDLVEEDYRFETAPHLIGGDRTALLQRKLDQYYRTTPFRHAAVQGREEEGRRDDKVLFSALTNPSLLTPWLEPMLQQAVPLKGIYSVPLVSRLFVGSLASSHVLLLTYQKQGGLRQSYFVHGQLNFTRLTPQVDSNNFVEKVLTESATTYKYLGSLSLLPTEHPLDVCIICGSHDKQELQARLRNRPDVRYFFLDMQQVGSQVKFQDTLQGSDATPLLLHLLARFAPANQYADREHTHFYQLWQVRRIIRQVTLATVLGTLGISGVNVWQGMELHRRTQKVAAEAKSLTDLYSSITQSFPRTPTSTENMKAAVSAARKLATYSPPPKQLLAGISQTLSDFPLIQVNSISWRATFSPDRVKPEGSAPKDTAAALPPSSPSQPGATASMPESPYQVIFIGGEIWPFDNNYRKALDTVNRFQEAIATKGVTVTPLMLPLDLRPEASLTGTVDEQGKPRKAAFLLKVVWSPAP